jgi:hypothetical protein
MKTKQKNLKQLISKRISSHMKQSALIVVLVLCAAVATAVVTTQTTGKKLRLGKHIQDSGPRSLWASHQGGKTGKEEAKKAGTQEGRNLNVSGAVWPTSVFWTTIQVGTPQKTFAVTIDTTSPYLFLSGKNCTGCVTTAPNVEYDPAESSTSKRTKDFFGKPDNFTQIYDGCNPTHPGEICAVSGRKYTDVVSLAGYGPSTMHVGAIESQTSNFYQLQTIDGTMGMMGSHRSPNGEVTTNVIAAVCINDGLCEPVWGICMQEGSVSNGTLTIGGVDSALAEGPIQYVPSQRPKTGFHREVEVPSLFIDGRTVSNPGNSFSGDRAILSTGTNYLALPGDLYNATQDAVCGNSSLAHCFEFFMGSKPPALTSCHSLTEAEVDAYPDITLELVNGVQLTMSSRDYLLKGSPAATSAGQYCFGIGSTERAFIIGETVMQNYYLVFAEHEIGWGKVNKQTCGSQ